MNRIYRLVWSKPRGMLIAVAETTRSRSKGGTPRQRRPRFKLTPIAAALALLGLSPTASYALPAGGQVAAGQATISTLGSTMNVTQASAKAILDWTSFGIGAKETVDFCQPSASSVALNRVVGTSASAIYGHLEANGQVFLVNPNGVYFAPGAQVDVGGQTRLGSFARSGQRWLLCGS
jgi:filamentous hemagglutinin family protein